MSSDHSHCLQWEVGPSLRHLSPPSLFYILIELLSLNKQVAVLGGKDASHWPHTGPNLL